MERRSTTTYLVAAAVAMLPFMQALTVDVGFPLKIYEVILVSAVLLLLLQKTYLRSTYFVSATALSLVLWLVAVFSVAAPLLVAGIPDGVEGARFGALGDSVAKVLYFLFVIFAYVVIYQEARRAPDFIIKAWLVGGVLASLYLFYATASSLLGMPPAMLPGMDSHQLMNIGGYVFVRSGTFDEGNFAALYFLFSVGFALIQRKHLLAFMFSVAVLATLSTIGLIGLVILSLLWVAFPASGSPRHNRFAWAASFAVVIVSLTASGYFQYIVEEKFSADNPGSYADRANDIGTAWAMFLDRPLLGVGLAQYGHHFHDYSVSDILVDTHAGKRIPNNVYLEFLAETGIIGFTLFVSLLFVWARQSFRRPAGRPLAYAGVAALIVLNAFPTFSLMYFWAFWALTGAVNDGLSKEQQARTQGLQHVEVRS